MGLRFNDIRGKLQRGLRRLRKEKPQAAEPAEAVKAPKLSDEAYNLLSSLYSELGPRPAASPGSRNAARRIASLLEAFSDDVTVTTGRIVPGLHHWMIISSMAFSAVMFLCSFIGLPYIAAAAGAFFIFCTLNDLRFRKNPLRSFFPSGDATNVHAVIEPSDTAERTLIFSAHHDTAAIRKTEKGKILSKLSLQTGAVGFAALEIISIVQIAAELVQKRLLVMNLPPFLPAVLSAAAFVFSLASMYAVVRSEGEYTAGAGDNLSGVSVVITLARYFSDMAKQGKGLRSTRLVFVSFDGEECGAEGSALWYRDNSHILVNPLNVNFDGIYDTESLSFLTSDGNGFVPLSSSLASKCSLLSAGMGYRIMTGRPGILGGSTDAASAAACGISATTITSMAAGKESPAHTEEDTPDKVSPEALSVALSVSIKLAEELDGPRIEEETMRTGLLENDRKYKLSRY